MCDDHGSTVAPRRASEYFGNRTGEGNEAANVERFLVDHPVTGIGSAR